jgi:hypothetical protein
MRPVDPLRARRLGHDLSVLLGLACCARMERLETPT